ncbi:hypothetical protein SCATT_p06030 (plasmid) [Streptantibioticus cattleyicolor NRRL 8057 = DSM 46488]|uniref:Uncharacterized protein n=1 Tax=Streptantibioticus cattleyicolor (strain ATCC 35852 / DSM 46488 / JCM 4925 / NBRC 14057 / NRRL 8057) TaxID=1003195 RepID=G8XGW9_STREN|nr:hypothetical protein SCATT_p06030 [Streptantibioticus cattleyicolor NRRL 8057 = DSM 46488]
MSGPGTTVNRASTPTAAMICANIRSVSHRPRPAGHPGPAGLRVAVQRRDRPGEAVVRRT